MPSRALQEEAPETSFGLLKQYRQQKQMPWKDLGLPIEWKEEVNQAWERPESMATQGSSSGDQGMGP